MTIVDDQSLWVWGEEEYNQESLKFHTHCFLRVSSGFRAVEPIARDWIANLGVRKSLSIAKNHPKPSQEFSEQIESSIHKKKGFRRNSPQKVHPNFAQNLGRQILGNTFSGLENREMVGFLMIFWAFLLFPCVLVRWEFQYGTCRILVGVSAQEINPAPARQCWMLFRGHSSLLRGS